MAEERTQQRRLAAIMAADVVGYSRLIEQDEAGTLSAIIARRREVLEPLLARHYGRIVKTMGDGVLVEFGSAVNAVQCALALQQGMKKANDGIDNDRHIILRIGINLGDVVIEGGDLYGDGVIVATRLENLAEAGSILISHTIYEHVDRRLPVHFEDQGERTLKNMARPIRVYRVDWQSGSTSLARQLEATQPGLPGNASIAVLPFTNMSHDPEQGFFVDGLAEDLITDLSKVPGLLVIARNSSFTYKGRAVDVRSIAKDLGVRYVIEGSVRRASTRVRINAQLVDAVTGSHLWADRFDRDLADIFLVQDEVVGKIVRALAGVLPLGRSVPTRRATNLEAYDLFVYGRSRAQQSFQDTRAARPLFEKAIKLDPNFAAPYAWLAMSHQLGWMYYDEGEEHRALALSAAKKAVSLDPENPDALMALGYLRSYEGELAEGIAQIEDALRINPNYADGWAMLADVRVLEGRAVEAINSIQSGFRLNPHPPGNYYWLLGWAQYAAGFYQDAVKTLRHKSTQGAGAKRILAAALAQLGQMAEAKKEARKFLSEFPHFSARQWADTQPFRNSVDRQHFIDGYIKAGLPE
jgi:adenylate cyclase